MAIVFENVAEQALSLTAAERLRLATELLKSVEPSGSTEEVDAVMAQAARAGARIVKAAGETFWGGYAGYFQDPDGHVWEIAWNRQAVIAE